MEALAEKLRLMSPQGCGIVLGRIEARPPSGFSEEEAIVTSAVPKRRQQFRAGRLLARQALEQVGCPAAQILAHSDGDPIWPTGFVGSISHTDHTAAAIAAPMATLAGVGLDVELDCELDAELRTLVCRSGELTAETELVSRGIDAAKLRFVAKEAYFKALFPIRRRFFDFLQVGVVFDVARHAFQVEVDHDDYSAAPPSGCEMMGRFARADGVLVALAYFRAQRPSSAHVWAADQTEESCNLRNCSCMRGVIYQPS
jgi:4'-phosphopantetheinyl transferase EntD